MVILKHVQTLLSSGKSCPLYEFSCCRSGIVRLWGIHSSVRYTLLYLWGWSAPKGHLRERISPPHEWSHFCPRSAKQNCSWLLSELQLIYFIMRLCLSIASSTAILCVIHIVLHRVFHNSDRFHANNPIKCWFQEE
jgi:hypothetical protein